MQAQNFPQNAIRNSWVRDEQLRWLGRKSAWRVEQLRGETSAWRVASAMAERLRWWEVTAKRERKKKKRQRTEMCKFVNEFQIRVSRNLETRMEDGDKEIKKLWNSVGYGGWRWSGPRVYLEERLWDDQDCIWRPKPKRRRYHVFHFLFFT